MALNPFYMHLNFLIQHRFYFFHLNSNLKIDLFFLLYYIVNLIELRIILWSYFHFKFYEGMSGSFLRNDLIEAFYHLFCLIRTFLHLCIISTHFIHQYFAILPQFVVLFLRRNFLYFVTHLDNVWYLDLSLNLFFNCLHFFF